MTTLKPFHININYSADANFIVFAENEADAEAKAKMSVSKVNGVDLGKNFTLLDDYEIFIMSEDDYIEDYKDWKSYPIEQVNAAGGSVCIDDLIAQKLYFDMFDEYVVVGENPTD